MLDNILALIAATIVLILIPGPNVALIVANTLSHGLKHGLITSFGTTVGIALQLGMVIGGMAALIELAATTLIWIKWLGVAYLIYLGVRTWFKTAGDLSQIRAQSTTHTFWRGLLLALVNPKTLLFNAAFLPQFVSGTTDAGSQLLLITAVFLAVILVGDALWAVFAASARGWLGRAGNLRNKITGGFLLGAGVALAFSRRGG